MPESLQVIFEIFAGVHQVQSCLSHSRKASSLELLTAANNWPRGLQTKVELQRQYVQLEKFESTISLMIEANKPDKRSKGNKRINGQGQRGTKESMDKLRAKCGALRDSLKAAAAK